MSETFDEKYNFFGNGILLKDPKIIGTLGHMIFTGRPDTKELKNKIAAFLY